MARQIDRQISGLQDYLDRLYKIVPTEITAAYLIVYSFLSDSDAPLKNFNLLLFFAPF